MSDALLRLKDLAISKTGFVFDPYTGATYTVNEVGRQILMGLREGLSRKDLLASLEEKFEITDADLDRDLDEFIHLLRENHLLPADFALDGGDHS